MVPKFSTTSAIYNHTHMSCVNAQHSSPDLRGHACVLQHDDLQAHTGEELQGPIDRLQQTFQERPRWKERPSRSIRKHFRTHHRPAESDKRDESQQRRCGYEPAVCVRGFKGVTDRSKFSKAE